MKIKNIILTILVIVSVTALSLFAVSCARGNGSGEQSGISSGDSSGSDQQGGEEAETLRYRVEYWWQNVDDDGYTLGASSSYDAAINTTVSAVIRDDFEGFTHVETDESVESAVLDNNSLTLKVYYDRKTFTLALSSDIDTELTGAGEYRYFKQVKISAVDITGYIFAGWYDGNDKVSESITYTYRVEKDVTLNAKWEPSNETKYAVEYYLQNIDDDGYEFNKKTYFTGNTGDNATAPAIEYTGFTKVERAESIESGDILADGSLVLKVYYDRNTYTVTLNGGNDVVTVEGAGTYRYGKQVQISASISVGGFDFLYWEKPDEKVETSQTFTHEVKEDITFKVEWKQTVTIGNVEKPLSLKNYDMNHAAKPETLDKEFAFGDNPYYVGDDNPFTMKPEVSFVKNDGSYAPVDEPKGWGGKGWEYNISLAIKDGDDFTVLSENDKDSYIDGFDEEACTIDFSEDAKGQIFEITIYPKGITFSEDNVAEFKDKSVSLTISVIDGYNVTKAIELAYIYKIENGEFKDYTTGYTNGKFNSGAEWTALANEKGLDLSSSHAAVILHNNITVTKDIVPAKYFYSENDEDVLTTDADYGEDNDSKYPTKVFGTLKDRTTLFFRHLSKGENFIIEGNYFTLSCEDFPLIIRGEGEVTTNGNGEILPGKNFVSHSQLFKFNADDDDYDGRAEIRNINLVGNAGKSNATALTGGLILIKTTNASLLAENNISNGWFINYFPDESDKRTDLNYCRAYDSYNSIIYLWGTSDVHIDHCDFNAAGGPAMIIDHVKQPDINDYTGDYKSDDFLYTGIPSKVVITNSSIHSYVKGGEAWFKQNNVTSTANTIKSFNPLFQNYDRSFLVGNKNDPTDEDPYLDIIAVFKSGAAENIDNPMNITGYFEMNGAECPMDFGTYSEAAITNKNSALCSAEQQYLKGIMNSFSPSAVFVSSGSSRQPMSMTNFNGIGGFLPAGDIVSTPGLYYGDLTQLAANDTLFDGDQLYLYYTGLGISVILGYYQNGATVDPTYKGADIRNM